MKTGFFPLFLLWSCCLFFACTRPESPGSHPAEQAQHEHLPPHGGTVVVLGDELYHLEFVHPVNTDRLEAFVFDGELDNFIRVSEPSFEIVAQVEGLPPQPLTFHAVANPLTGETVGQTASFEARADWLKTAGRFDAVIPRIHIRGQTFTDVKFTVDRERKTDASR